MDLHENAGSLFEINCELKPANAQSEPDKQGAIIGQLNVELNWLKKVLTHSLEERTKWIEDPKKVLALSAQCEVLAMTW